MSYIPWCAEALFQDVYNNCRRTDTSEARACARQLLHNVESYMLREYLTPCAGIMDDGAYQQCTTDTGNAFNAHNRNLKSGCVNADGEMTR